MDGWIDGWMDGWIDTHAQKYKVSELLFCILTLIVAISGLNCETYCPTVRHKLVFLSY